MEISELINFEIKSDHIVTMGDKFCYFHISPPNFTTLDGNDKERYRQNFENLLRNLEDISINIFAMDRTVNLDANRQYINSFSDEYDYIKDALLDNLNSMEAHNGNTQRSYYFVLKYDDPTVVLNVQDILRANSFHARIAAYDELVSVMRCFLLREFIDHQIYVCEVGQ